MGEAFLAAGRVGTARGVLLAACVLFARPVVCAADAFENYALTATVSLPTGAGPFDVLADGRIMVLVNDQVWTETTAGGGGFSLRGLLPAADLPPFGAAFLRVSPDGTRLAVGNNGGATFADFAVGVFDVDTLAGDWFSANHFDAAWVDNTRLALTAGSFGSPAMVTVLDTSSPDPAQPTNPVVVANIGGASGGIAFDGTGRLFTGNGFGLIGPSGTGTVKAFDQAAWTAATAGGAPLDFEVEGTLVVDVLSASPLGFDAEGNLLVGGGDVAPDADSVAVVRASAVADALAGGGPADPNDPAQVRRLDPITTGANFYSVAYNAATRELYVRDFGDPTLYVYRDRAAVPTVSHWGLGLLALFTLAAGTAAIRRRAAGRRCEVHAA